MENPIGSGEDIHDTQNQHTKPSPFSKSRLFSFRSSPSPCCRGDFQTGHGKEKPDESNTNLYYRGLQRIAMINLYQEESAIEVKAAACQSASTAVSSSPFPTCPAQQTLLSASSTWRTSSNRATSHRSVYTATTTRNGIMKHIFRWSLLLLASSSHFVRACTDVFNNYTLLVNELDLGGAILLCPFTIQGAQCPDTPYVVTSPFLFVFCANFGGGAGDACVLNCPQTHFDVQPFAWLTLDSITLSGAVNVSTIVRQDGSFTASYSTFQNNTGLIGGGAIYSEGNLNVESSHFIDNAAPQGGAIYSSEGEMIIMGGSFLNNRAQSRGGAIFSGGNFADISSARFESNSAPLGPAVFTAQTVTTSNNQGCGNDNGNGADVCNGVASSAAACQDFDLQCTFVPTSTPTGAPTTATPTVLPTQAPSTEPSELPTMSWTDSPTQQPSTTPSARPSQVPSAVPTASPTSTRPSTVPSGLPTQSPTNRPSAAPSDTPTLRTSVPSQSPLDNPSASPSSTPTGLPTLSSEPSFSPTPVPSVLPSHEPTKLPTGNPTLSPTTVAPSLEPSLVPTVEPTTMSPTHRPTGTI